MLEALIPAETVFGLFLIAYLYFYSMDVLLVFMSVLHLCASSRGGQKKASGSLEQELQAVVSHFMSAGN